MKSLNQSSWKKNMQRTALVGGAAMLLLSSAGGETAYTLGGAAYAAEAQSTVKNVTITYPASAVTVALNERLPLLAKLKLSEPVALRYESGNGAVARVNSDGVIIPVAAGKTKIRVHVTSASYKGKLELPVTIRGASTSYKAVAASKRVSAGGRSFNVQTVAIPKGMPVTAGLPSRTVGLTQGLSGIASLYNAAAAINGTYFESYGGIPEPYGNIISDGVVEHIGNTGTSIGFQWDGSALMDTLQVKMSGKVSSAGKSSQSWYVYFVNRTPTPGRTAAIMYTPKRGSKIGMTTGSAVTVSKGVVTKVSKNTNVEIPKDGYVLFFTGEEEHLASRFQKGSYVDYTVSYNDVSGKAIDWSEVHTAIGAGPRLVKDGKLAVDPANEGFVSPKILTDSGARSGIAIMNDGSILLVTVPAATMKQWGQIMVSLGAKQAMNLDGGASSGLYANGKQITPAGRELSNALVFSSLPKW
ncbi:phosphodiester glycosidase family protein [Paenibacillus algorifonticola]|uniref:phosphodiester glycosidase family protein n=1 Tax=Paenibacillus algorifonticola TaxID=684063 RepID=UPI003D2DC8C9